MTAAERPRWGRTVLTVLFTVALVVGAWFVHGGPRAFTCGPTTRAVERAFGGVEGTHTVGSGACAFDGDTWLTVSVRLAPTGPEDFTALGRAAREVAEDPAIGGAPVEIVVDAGPVTLRLLDWEALTEPTAQLLWDAHRAGVEIFWDNHLDQQLAADDRGVFEVAVRGEDPSAEGFRTRVEAALRALEMRPPGLPGTPTLWLEWHREGAVGGTVRLIEDETNGRGLGGAAELLALLTEVDDLGADLGRPVRVESQTHSTYVSPSPAAAGGLGWTPEQTARVRELERTLERWGQPVTSFEDPTAG